MGQLKVDRIGHRKIRGSTGGRPPTFDAYDYKGRDVVERNLAAFKQGNSTPRHGRRAALRRS
jgi:hypothetical protein